MKGQISTVLRGLRVGKRVALAAAVLCGLVGIVLYLAVTQEQNAIEEELQQSPLIGVTTSTQNPLQLALLHWYNADLTTAFGVGDYGIAFDGANIWITNAADNTVSKLRASDGRALATFAAGSNPDGVAFDGANVWVADVDGNKVHKLRASDGKVLGSFTVRGTPVGVAFDGANVWVANGTSNNVSPRSASVDPTGRFLYVTNSGSNNVSAYTLDSSTGELKTISGSPFGAGSHPNSVAVDVTGSFAYVANHGSNNVSAYVIDPGTGALTEVTGSPFASGTLTRFVQLESSGRFVYVTNEGSNTVWTYSIGPAGALTPIARGKVLARQGPMGIGFFAGRLPVTYTPKFAYVANDSTSGSVSGYRISTTSGALMAIPGRPSPPERMPSPWP